MTPEVPDVRTATLQDIKRKLYCARTISSPDSSGNPVNVGDMVDLVSQGNARLEGVSGTVKYIQRGALWLTVKWVSAASSSSCSCSAFMVLLLCFWVVAAYPADRNCPACMDPGILAASYEGLGIWIPGGMQLSFLASCRHTQSLCRGLPSTFLRVLLQGQAGC